MQTEERVERDADLIHEYIEILNRRATRPSPFGKLAAFTKLGSLRRRLAAAVSRHPDPEVERAEAAAVAETTGSWARRFATSFWGARLLMLLLLVIGQQFVLLALLVFSTAYTNVATFPPSVERGYVPAATRFSIVFLIVFVFAFYAAVPVLSALLLWGGRFFRSWRLTVPVVTLVLLVSAVATYLTFRKLENPAFKPDSIHEFVDTRPETRGGGTDSDVIPYLSYTAWLDGKGTAGSGNWLLKDPKLKADYEEYLRNGPGRWLTNNFDTSDPAAWADPKALVAIGTLVDTEHDQAKFREWLKDYADRNKINSAGIDDDIDALVGPANHRFLSIWQAEPFLRERDVNIQRHYFSEVFKRLRVGGMIFFGVLIVVYLLIYLIGPTVVTAGWIARSLKLSRAAGAIGRFRDRYYRTPERTELAEEPYYDDTLELFARVHRSYVRAVLATSVIVFGALVILLASRPQPARPMATQNALMHRFVALPSSGPSAAPAGAAPSGVGPIATASPLPANTAGAFQGGTGDPNLAVDADGDGLADERPLPPLEARLAALQKRVDDSEYDVRKRFKTTATLLEAYRREIDALRAQNAQLEQRQGELLGTTSALGSRISATEGQIRGASQAAAEARGRAEAVDARVADLADSFEERTESLDRRAGALEKRDDEIQSTVDAVAADLDEKSTELRARTERLGERATDLAERAEQIAELQRTAYTALVDEFNRQIDSLDRRSHSRLYRMFNKKEARAQLADLRRRIQLVRSKLRDAGDADSLDIDKQLVEIQERIGPVEERYQ